MKNLPCQAMRSEENGCKEKAQWGIRRIKLGISEVLQRIGVMVAQNTLTVLEEVQILYPLLVIIFLITSFLLAES